MDGRRGDTRTRIREVALEMFTERGYDSTSLREIAERLDVTKAALYYHFKTKEEIVVSLFEDICESVAQLVEWVRSQPPGPATRREALLKFIAHVHSRHGHMIGLMHQSQPSLRDLKVGQQMRQQVLQLGDAIAGPHATPAEVLRTRLALMCVSAGMFVSEDLDLGETRMDAIADAAFRLMAE